MRTIFLFLIFLLSFLQVPGENKSLQVLKRKDVVLFQNKSTSQDSLDIKIGQMIIFGIYGTTINKKDPVYVAVREGKIGNILLYRRNISTNNTIEKLQQLNNSLQAAAQIPLFISIDQEGGLVNRFEGISGFADIPSAFYLGSKNNINLTRKVGGNIAGTLLKCGINLNYAPVLDLHNVKCPVMGARQRCFSSNSNEVAKHAGQIIAAHDSLQILTVVKHFPGHGNTIEDSHLGVADASNSWKEDELTPYKILFEQNLVKAVMTAHIVNKKLDKSGLPATLSKPIITGILREKLGFNGVVFSDDLMMQAINKKYTLKETVQLSINAGVDILMFSNNINGVNAFSPANIHKTIKSLVISGKIPNSRINESYQRIMEMKQSRK